MHATNQAQLEHGVRILVNACLNSNDRVATLGQHIPALRGSRLARRTLGPTRGLTDVKRHEGCLLTNRCIGRGSLHDLSLIHISEPTRLGMISYAVFCLKKK